MNLPRALTFDVFGTVVDWRSSIAREVGALASSKGIHGNWTAFADAWRAGYRPAMDRVRQGALPWTKLDALHRGILDAILPQFGLEELDEAERAELNRAWHRLDPWPEAVEGLQLLKRRFVIASLSNGNVSLLVNMAKRAGLPWDAVLSAEFARRYKPDPEVYRLSADWLGVEPDEAMMVAAHPTDLRAAAKVGFQTAYVPRPLEYGPGGFQQESSEGEFDLVAQDFIELDRLLG